jgi:hypothetical protein
MPMSCVNVTSAAGTYPHIAHPGGSGGIPQVELGGGAGAAVGDGGFGRSTVFQVSGRPRGALIASLPRCW